MIKLLRISAILLIAGGAANAIEEHAGLAACKQRGKGCHCGAGRDFGDPETYHPSIADALDSALAQYPLPKDYFDEMLRDLVLGIVEEVVPESREACKWHASIERLFRFGPFQAQPRGRDEPVSPFEIEFFLRKRAEFIYECFEFERYEVGDTKKTRYQKAFAALIADQFFSNVSAAIPGVAISQEDLCSSSSVSLLAEYTVFETLWSEPMESLFLSYEKFCIARGRGDLVMEEFSAVCDDLARYRLLGHNYLSTSKSRMAERLELYIAYHQSRLERFEAMLVDKGRDVVDLLLPLILRGLQNTPLRSMGNVALFIKICYYEAAALVYGQSKEEFMKRKAAVSEYIADPLVASTLTIIPVGSFSKSEGGSASKGDTAAEELKKILKGFVLNLFSKSEREVLEMHLLCKVTNISGKNPVLLAGLRKIASVTSARNAAEEAAALREMILFFVDFDSYAYLRECSGCRGAKDVCAAIAQKAAKAANLPLFWQELRLGLNKKKRGEALLVLDATIETVDRLIKRNLQGEAVRYIPRFRVACDRSARAILKEYRKTRAEASIGDSGDAQRVSEIFSNYVWMADDGYEMLESNFLYGDLISEFFYSRDLISEFFYRIECDLFLEETPKSLAEHARRAKLSRFVFETLKTLQTTSHTSAMPKRTDIEEIVLSKIYLPLADDPLLLLVLGKCILSGILSGDSPEEAFLQGCQIFSTHEEASRSIRYSQLEKLYSEKVASSVAIRISEAAEKVGRSDKEQELRCICLFLSSQRDPRLAEESLAGLVERMLEALLKLGFSASSRALQVQPEAFWGEFFAVFWDHPKFSQLEDRFELFLWLVAKDISVDLLSLFFEMAKAGDSAEIAGRFEGFNDFHQMVTGSIVWGEEAEMLRFVALLKSYPFPTKTLETLRNYLLKNFLTEPDFERRGLQETFNFICKITNKNGSQIVELLTSSLKK